MYQQNPNPTGSLTLSALLALLPLVALLVLLGGLRWKAHWAGIATLVLAGGVAVIGYGMPVGLTLNTAAFGVAQSVLVVLWITFNAIWIHNLTVHSGHFEVLRRAFCSVSDDLRVQGIVIAFAFGANTLFGGLQSTAAQQLGASPILFGAANSSGGVMAKMISPQNLAVGTAAVGLVGKEGELFRRVFGWRLLLLLVMCVLVYLQSTPVLGWMVP